MGIFTNVMGRVSKSGRNLASKTYAQEKRVARAQISAIKNQQEFRKTEDVREQAGLKQGMFGRGLGKSSIFEQDKDRLTNIQKYRNEALAKQLVIAERGLSLIKKRWRYGKRVQWAQSVDDLIAVAGGVVGIAGGFGGGGGSPGVSQDPSGAPYADGYSGYMGG